MQDKLIEERARKFFEVGWNGRDFEYLDQIIDASYHPEWVLMPETGSNLVKREIRYITSAIPNFKYKIMDLVQDQNKVWIWYQMSGTQKGKFFGFPPSGKSFSSDGASILFFNHQNQIENRMGFYCFEEIFHQLGLGPPYWDLHRFLTDYSPVSIEEKE